MKNKSSVAFSLFEMLVAMSLFTLLMALLFTLSTKMWQEWHRQECQQKYTSEAGFLLQKMTRDLRSAVLVPGCFFINLPTIDTSCRKNIFFLTTTSSSKTSGDLCAVGYFFVAEKNRPERYECYHFTASAQKTSEALQNQHCYDLFAKASPDNSGSCQRIASGIIESKIKPVWVVDGKIFNAPPKTSANTTPSPALMEISITMGDHRISKSSKERVTTKTFSTTIALPHTS